LSTRASWQEIDEWCRSCQFWLSVVNRRFTAMEIMQAVLLVAGIIAAVAATIHAVLTDGYRQVPRVR